MTTEFNADGTHKYFTGAPSDLHLGQFTTALLALDAMLHSPVSGHQRAFHVRKQLAYCQQRVGATDVFDYPVPVRYRRNANGHKPTVIDGWMVCDHA